MRHVPSRRTGGKAAKTLMLRYPHRERSPTMSLAFLFCLAALCSVFLLLMPKASKEEDGSLPIDPGCWVFQHLHKSGGMTIRRIMSPPKGDLEEDGEIVGYGTDEWRLGQDFRDGTLAPELLDEKRYRIATGGYTGALRLSSGLAESCKFFTVFRHPVNRLVSAFYYCRSPKHSWDPLCASSVMDATTVNLVDFAEHWGNYAVRQMAMAFVPAEDVVRYVDETVGEGRPALLNGVPVEDIPSWFLLKSYLRHRYHQSGGGGGGTEAGDYAAGALNDDAALAGLMGSIETLLRHNFTAIGVVEDFDASMKLFDDAGVIPGKHWAATYGKLGAANRGEAAETKEGAVLRHALLSSEIKKYLRLDILLYDHAVAVFQDMKLFTRGTFRQLSYAQALKRVGCQSVEATVRQRRLLFAGAVARQPDGRLPKRLMFGELEGGENPGRGSAEQNWGKCVTDDLKEFGAAYQSTDAEPHFFGVPGTRWMEAARVRGGVPWHAGVVEGAERFMNNWRKEEEEASRQRATKRDIKTKSSVDAAKNKGAGKGKRKGETAKEESERELADRVARHAPD